MKRGRRIGQREPADYKAGVATAKDGERKFGQEESQTAVQFEKGLPRTMGWSGGVLMPKLPQEGLCHAQSFLGTIHGKHGLSKDAGVDPEGEQLGPSVNYVPTAGELSSWCSPPPWQPRMWMGASPPALSGRGRTQLLHLQPIRLYSNMFQKAASLENLFLLLNSHLNNALSFPYPSQFLQSVPPKVLLLPHPHLHFSLLTLSSALPFGTEASPAKTPSDLYLVKSIETRQFSSYLISRQHLMRLIIHPLKYFIFIVFCDVTFIVFSFYLSYYSLLAPYSF